MARFLWLWYWLQWWTPEGKTCRAFHRHSRAVYCDLRRRGIDEAHAEEVTLLAFEVLHQQYRIGATHRHVREVAMIVARAVAGNRRTRLLAAA